MLSRRKFTALLAPALLMGLAIGFVPGVAAAGAKSVSDDEPLPEAKPGQAKAPAPEKKAPAPVRCKTTKNCQKGEVCQKVDDHKECVAPPVKVPRSSMMT